MTVTLPAGPLLLRSTIIPTSADEANLTVIATVSTGAPVRRRDETGPFIERLDLNGIDPRSLVGVQVLNSHRSEGIENIVGVVIDAGRDARGLWAKIQFSERHLALFRDVKAGVVRYLSVGYRVGKWRLDPAGADGIPVRTALQWSVAEVSFVATPADPAAQVRKEPDTMSLDDPAAKDAAATTDPADDAGFTPCETCTTPAGCKKAGFCVADVEEEPAGSATDPAAPPTPETETRKASRQRIRGLQRSLNLSEQWAIDLIRRNATEAQVRAATFDALVSNRAPNLRTDGPRITMGASFDDPTVRAAYMGEALYARANPAHQLSAPARQYAYSGPSDMARELLHLRGVSTMGMSPAAIITRSMHTTHDFPVILGDLIGRTLRQAYQSAPSGIRQTARVVSAKDFRTRHSVQLSEAPILKRLSESGEISAGSMAESVETYKVETFARKLAITRQSLVNDDLGAFTDLSRRFGQAAAETEAVELVALITKNAGAGPTLSDGVNLFHADHKNLAGAGAAISDTTLSAAREAMRTQKGISGQTVSVPPKFLVVPAALETTADKWLASITPATAANVNPFSGKLDLVVEPRLDAISQTRWYIGADPAVIDGLEIAYLTGSNGPMVEPVKDADTDGVTLKVVHDFGVGFVEHRSWYANPGA